MNKYSTMLSPIKVGSRLLKNRFICTRAVSGAFQGDENYPGEAMITHMAELARNGAAIVTCQGADWASDPYFGGSPDMGPGGPGGPGGPMGKDEWGVGSLGGPGMGNLDFTARGCKLYYSHMCDEIHFYGSLASASMMGIEPRSICLSPDLPGEKSFGPPVKAREATTDELEHLIESFAQRALAFKEVGFDMVCFYMSYGTSMMAKSLSPVYNRREDKFGGSPENRARFTLDIFRRTRELCGPDFLIEAQVSAVETHPDGYKVPDFIQYAKMCEGLVDIFQLRAPDGDLAHPTGLNSLPGAPLTLAHAEALKKAGVNIVIAPNGGYQNLDDIESYLVGGKADMIAVARAFICDPDFIRKARLGRGEDVVPCLRCNRCHCRDTVKCYVNPKMGLEHKILRMTDAATTGKRVCVVGGGVAGMWAAYEAAKRGHTVTLYEKSGSLGGLLNQAGAADFKWPVKDFKNWLIGQMDKLGVKVKLNTEADPAEINAAGFDAVLAAVGSKPKLPPIPGVENKNVVTPVYVYGNHEKLGRHIVVIGGSETGTETALYLARLGHSVTLLCRKKKVAYDAQNSHYYSGLMAALKESGDLKMLTETETMEITASGVRCKGKDGVELTLPADTVVACGGFTPCHDEAMKYYPKDTSKFFAIGDCFNVGSILTCTRSAFSAVSQI